MQNKTCPLCKKNLSLKQINFNLAVYICDDLQCSYPVGFDCIVVERKREDMNKECDLKGDTSNWMDEAVANIEKTPVVPNNEWIDELVERAVSEVQSNNGVTAENNTSPVVDTDFDEILNFISS